MKLSEAIRSVSRIATNRTGPVPVQVVAFSGEFRVNLINGSHGSPKFQTIWECKTLEGVETGLTRRHETSTLDPNAWV